MCFFVIIIIDYRTTELYVMASKNCNRCKRMHTTKYKCCPTCLAYCRKSVRKRKRTQRLWLASAGKSGSTGKRIRRAPTVAAPTRSKPTTTWEKKSTLAVTGLGGRGTAAQMASRKQRENCRQKKIFS